MANYKAKNHERFPVEYFAVYGGYGYIHNHCVCMNIVVIVSTYIEYIERPELCTTRD